MQGKSLSLICGALTWLKDYEEKKKEEAARLLQGEMEKEAGGEKKELNGVQNNERNTEKGSGGSATEPDWVSEFVQKRAEREMVNKLKVIH